MLISATLALAVATAATPVAERDQLRQSEHMYWRAINATQFDLWLGKEEAWRLTVSALCPAWPSTHLTLITQQGHLKRQQEIIAKASAQCRLLRIEPLPSNADHTLPIQKVITVDAAKLKGNNKH
ncbi:hypothetical protein NT239_09440 [Chitinibacter sp. SCUT-21]|uniref:hypothetical protein n=1 Tax=Chitinibacter sp. SCUT-21 TaxID=2970891 RepID=UPI0035A64459